ncbi:MAG: hypothetical protein JZU45_03205 [Methyloversatilis discipulorum]|jgi:hypothetical protein|uniref:hypothetical protein n=1 Tax=Methyloversatilis discipulorum TaxID=1119528 RepID=UPI000376B624|nr:hypothetical protein [Methyloversatilis discipulorum]MBV5285066.1 hypothetical protein [Methyloversatilis discipulorum]
MLASTLNEFPRGAEVQSVTYDLKTLVVRTGVGPTLRFKAVIGFRFLDEGDLLEFWPSCSAKCGGLFEIHDGGWLQQEGQRSGFISTANREGVREFLVTGPDGCLSVLSFHPPEIDVESPRVL